MAEKIELVFAIIGGVGTLLTMIGALAPADGALARFCARFGSALKSVHAPPVPK